MSGSLLRESAEKSFARHETFHPRFGWLRKAVTHAADLGREDAPVILGVGKNMVTAVRYWGRAFRVLEVDGNGKAAPLKVSDFGRALLGDGTPEHDDNALDPWLEDPASLWLLHWELLQPNTLAPAWWAAFNSFPSSRFTEQALTLHVRDLAESAWGPVNEATIAKDVDCMVRMYGSRPGRGRSFDDLIDSPFRELGLITPVPGESHAWRFTVGPKTTLPDAIVAWACVRYMSAAGRSRTASLAQLTSDPGTPGQVFKLNEMTLFGHLEAFGTVHPHLIRVVDQMGLRQLQVTPDRGEPMDRLAKRILDQHYKGDPTA